MRLRTPLLLASLILPLLVHAQAAPWPTAQWATATPQAQGMDAAVLAELVDFGAANDMDSLVVTRRGYLVAEAYYAPFKPAMRHRINSATKAVVGALTGIAIGQGKLQGSGQKVVDLLADRTIVELDERKKAMTVQHLLDMTSGLAWDEALTNAPPRSMFAMEETADWGQFVLDRPMAEAPGTAFNYNSGNSQLLATILAKQTGMLVLAYAQQQLFGPMGISNVQWRADPQGTHIGGYGLYLQTRDMAKLGYLYLNGGQWDGKQLVPADWVAKVFQAQVPMNLAPGVDLRYGDQWWTLPARKTYMAVGYNRQLVVVMPQTGVVAALTGRKNYPFTGVLNLLDKAVKGDAPLPPNAAAQALLQQRVAAVAQETAVPAAMPAWAQTLDGKTWKVGPNPLGIMAFTLHWGAQPVLAVERRVRRGSAQTRTDTIALGLDGRFAEGLPDGSAVVGKVEWTGDNTLTLRTRSPEESQDDTHVMRFSGNTVDIRYANSFGFRTMVKGEAAN